jgi:hypothetical protein
LHLPLASPNRQVRILGPIVLCALGKAHRSPRWKSGPAKLSLQPEAIGADQEATNNLKHFDRKAS